MKYWRRIWKQTS